MPLLAVVRRCPNSRLKEKCNRGAAAKLRPKSRQEPPHEQEAINSR
jgi:hypothetical protein